MTPYIFPGLNRNHQLLISPTDAVKCDKKDCFFCYLMIGKAVHDTDIADMGNRYSKNHCFYILKNYKYRNSIAVSEIAHRLKRTRRAIMQKHYQLTH